MKKFKAYRAVDVKHVGWERLVQGKEGLDAMVGLGYNLSSLRD